MGCNNYKFNDTCGQSVFATCVDVEITFPTVSNLNGETCSDLDSVIQDLYELVDESYVDMSVYDKGCLDYSPTADADITPIQVLNKLTSELCTLKTTVGTFPSASLIPQLDMSAVLPLIPAGCFSGTCEADPQNLQELLIAIIGKLCACNCS